MESFGSPWAGKATGLYRLIADSGHDPAVWLAIGIVEHRLLTDLDAVAIRLVTNSWTNARSVRIAGLPHTIVTTDHLRDAGITNRDGPYVGYRSVEDSLRDGMFRITDPAYVYQQEHGPDITIGEVLNLWTESDAARYIATVVDLVNSWTGGARDLTTTLAARIAQRGIEVHDIRDRMVKHDRMKYARLPNTAWRYIAVHHTAVGRGVRGLDGDIRSWRNHSIYHVQTRGWPGIAYAIGISLSGRVFMLRDIELKGFHAFTANDTALGIVGDLTTGNRITDGFRRALDVVLDVLTEAPEIPNLLDRPGVFGHNELEFIDDRNDETTCPGDVLPLVHAYRRDKEIDMPPPAPERITFDGNPYGDFGYVRGFGGFVWRHGWLDSPDNPKQGILALVGYPMGEEYATTFGAAQECEKAVLHWLRDAKPPWDIQLAQIADDDSGQPPARALPILGANYVNPTYGDWHRYQRPLGRRARFDLAKIYLPNWTRWMTAHADDLISDGVETLILRTDDIYVGYDETRRLLVSKGWMEYIKRRPSVQFVIEVGNEPDQQNWDLNRYRVDLLDTINRLKPEIDQPNMTWIASMPREIDAMRAVLADGEVAKHYDGFGIHLYGHFQIGDDGTAALYRHALNETDRDIWVTEMGINDPSLSAEVKAGRYLEWLENAHERVAGVALWLIAEPGSTLWAVGGHYPISDEMADVLAGRRE